MAEKLEILIYFNSPICCIIAKLSIKFHVSIIKPSSSKRCKSQKLAVIFLLVGSTPKTVFECVAVFDILHDQEIITKQEFENLIGQADELSRMMYAMIKNLAN